MIMPQNILEASEEAMIMQLQELRFIRQWNMYLYNIRKYNNLRQNTNERERTYNLQLSLTCCPLGFAWSESKIRTLKLQLNVFRLFKKVIAIVISSGNMTQLSKAIDVIFTCSSSIFQVSIKRQHHQFPCLSHSPHLPPSHLGKPLWNLVEKNARWVGCWDMRQQPEQELVWEFYKYARQDEIMQHTWKELMYILKCQQSLWTSKFNVAWLYLSSKQQLW